MKLTVPRIDEAYKQLQQRADQVRGDSRKLCPPFGVP